MKRIAVFLFLAFAAFSLTAYTIDEAVDYVMESGALMDRDGTTVFMANEYINDEYFEEDSAYHYLAQTAYVFLTVRMGWESCSNSRYVSKIRSVQEIAAPWTNDYQTFIVHIPMREISNQFGDIDYDEYDEDTLFEEIYEYIEYHADHSPESMY